MDEIMLADLWDACFCNFPLKRSPLKAHTARDTPSKLLQSLHLEITHSFPVLELE